MYLSMAVTMDAPGVHAAIASRWMGTGVSFWFHLGQHQESSWDYLEQAAVLQGQGNT